MSSRARPARVVTVACTIELAQDADALYTHVTLRGVEVWPGDVVAILDPPAQVPFGTRAAYQRVATVRRAGRVRRAWMHVRGYFEICNLVEVGFAPADRRSSHA